MSFSTDSPSSTPNVSSMDPSWVWMTNPATGKRRKVLRVPLREEFLDRPVPERTNLTPPLADVIEALELSWCAATSADSNWTPTNPTLGQCAVTALVIKDLYGGDLLRCSVGSTSHYWNRIHPKAPGQELWELDLTVEQFGARHLDRCEVVIRDRDYVLGYPDTVKRYELLSSFVSGHLERLLS